MQEKQFGAFPQAVTRPSKTNSGLREEQSLPTAAAELESYILPPSALAIVNTCTKAFRDDMHALHTDGHGIKQSHSQNKLASVLIAQTFHSCCQTRVSSGLQGLQRVESGMQTNFKYWPQHQGYIHLLTINVRIYRTLLVDHFGIISEQAAG